MRRALPTIDLGGFIAAPHSAAGRDTVERLCAACRRPGFCYLTGHGVPAALDAAIASTAQEFFSLPDAEKRALAITNSPHFRGHTPLGGERTRDAADWREQFDIGPEEPAAAVTPGDPPWLRLRGPNQWPRGLPGMQPAVLDWMAAMDHVGLTVLRALALGLGQPIDAFDHCVLPRGDPHLKLVRYPPQPPASDDGQGVGLHHDSGLISFVLQDDAGGLQAEIDGQLVDVEPQPGSYVMNLGEMLQAATDGYLCATPHRVNSPPTGRERISIAYFYHPRLECRFDAIPLPSALAAEARGGQNADPADPVRSRFGDNYLKIRLRSHPDVAEIHYGDLIAG